MSSPTIINALTFDVEEYFQVSAFESVIKREDWKNWESRVEFATGKILDLLDEHNVKATFFTLGTIAEKHPGLVRRIVESGHELGCHGLQHTRIVDQNKIEFKNDINRAKSILEDIAGKQVSGYRAASFSINADNFWAFDELAEAGFIYSSSIYPVKHDLYGIPDAPRFPFKPVDGNNILEIPVSTVSVFGKNIPAGGGGFFRLFPYMLTSQMISSINKQGESANMYFHPWEFDPKQPRPRGLSPKTKFRHYLNQSRALTRLARALESFRWSSMWEVYRDSIESTATT